MRRLAAAAIAMLASCAPVGPEAPPSRALVMTESLPPMKTFTATRVEAPARPNAEIAQDFMELSFRMESGRAIPYLTRFTGPISVRISGPAPASLVPDLRALLSRLQNEAGIDIFMTGAPQASITIETVPHDELQRLVPHAACFVVPRVSSWAEFKAARRSEQVDWTALRQRDQAAIFVPSDVAPQEVRDCLHEELAQALGPLNDLYRLPDSVFNDDNIQAVLTGFDMLILRAYYAPELRNGMTRPEVAARLPAVLARLNPAGQRGPSTPPSDTSRDWISAIETALSSGPSPSRRRQSAEQAINIARANRWSGPRQGFAYYAYARLQVSNDPQLALGSFQAADRAYRASPLTRLHVAHVAVQLAAFSLIARDGPGTLRIVDEAIPVAAAHENAALLATLMMFRAEALGLIGRDTEAQAVRLDSLGWARYGFGSEVNVRARQREIAALTQRQGS